VQSVCLHLRSEELTQQRLTIGNIALLISLRPTRRVTHEKLGEMVDAFAIHRRDDAIERRRLNACDFHCGRRSAAEPNASVNLNALCDESGTKSSGRERRRIFDDILVTARQRPRADAPGNHDRAVSLTPY